MWHVCATNGIVSNMDLSLRLRSGSRFQKGLLHLQRILCLVLLDMKLQKFKWTAFTALTFAEEKAKFTNFLSQSGINKN
jgi:hypothetical protein